MHFILVQLALLDIVAILMMFYIYLAVKLDGYEIAETLGKSRMAKHK